LIPGRAAGEVEDQERLSAILHLAAIIAELERRLKARRLEPTT